MTNFLNKLYEGKPPWPKDDTRLLFNRRRLSICMARVDVHVDDDLRHLNITYRR